MGSFWLPEWILDVLVTAVVLFVGALFLHARTIPGVIAASLAVVVAYATVLVVPDSQHYSNQRAIWVWMLLVVTTVWTINRFRRTKVEEGRQTI